PPRPGRRRPAPPGRRRPGARARPSSSPPPPARRASRPTCGRWGSARARRTRASASGSPAASRRARSPCGVLSIALLALEHGGALLQEGGHPLPLVLGAEEHGEPLTLQLVGG